MDTKAINKTAAAVGLSPTTVAAVVETYEGERKAATARRTKAAKASKVTPPKVTAPKAAKASSPKVTPPKKTKGKK
jgi:hypothetical protein